MTEDLIPTPTKSSSSRRPSSRFSFARSAFSRLAASDRPLSVQIGRIVVRLLLAGVVLWGAYAGYQAYLRHQLAKEIAPIHAHALHMIVALKKGHFFAAQAYLAPPLRHTISIDRLAYFAEHTKLAATRTGTWGEWNATREANATQYHLNGELVYTNGETHPMRWTIQKGNDRLDVLDLVIGKRSLIPAAPSAL